MKSPIVIAVVAALIITAAGLATYISFFSLKGESSTEEVLMDDDGINSTIEPDASAVPEDQPIPPAPRELVLQKNQQTIVTKKDLRRYDKNKDGLVSREEYRNLWSDQFDNLDKNRDGKLALQEWRKHRHAFKQMDLNKSKSVERPEWLRYRDWCFDTFWDADKDGFATPETEWTKK